MKRGEPFNVLRDRNSWSNAPRAEAIVLTVGGFSSAAAATAALGTVGYTLAVGAASLALSVATSAIISALTPVPPTPKQSLLVNARDAAGPQEFVYGETRKGGTITYLETTRGGSVLYQVIALAAHEIESVEEIYINDEVAVLSNDAYSNSRRSGAGWVTNRNWSDDSDEHEIRIFYHLGDQTAITDTFANSSVETLDSVFFDTGSSDEDSQNFGGVGQPTKASFVGNGIAYLFVRFGYASGVFQNGIPVITAKIRGKKVFDPRTSTTAYSNNAALCIRDFLTSAYGLNDPEVDDTVFQAAANTCDEAVTLDAGGTESRYTINGVVRADQSYGDVLQEMVKSCAGTLFWGAGKWKLQPGEYNAPTKTFTLDDLRSEISLQTRVNLRDQFNRVQGVFSDANQRYIAADYPPIESAAFKTQDGEVEQTLDLDLPFTTSAATAQRLAKMTLFRGREQMTFSAEFGLNAFDVEVGEIVALTIDRYGWTAKEFEVVGWRFGANGDAGDLRVTLTLRETSEAAFDWDAEEEDIIGNDTDLSGTPEPVSNLTASAYGVIAADGTFVNGILVDWDSSPSASRYELEWTVNDSINYAANGGIVAEASAVTTREQFIYKGYIEILFRQPDQDGFDFYNTGGGSGLDEEAFRAQLLASPERNTVKFAGITVREPTTQYVIKPVLDGIIYNIRVRAFNTFDQKSEWRSVTFTTSVKDGTIPSAPTGLTATGGVGSVKLGWNPVTTNADAEGSAANDIFLYNIYKDTSPIPFGDGTPDPALLEDNTAGAGWSDVSLTDSTTYYYRVTAVDFSGNESAYSNEASATTSAAVTDGADGANGDRTYTGRLYHHILTATSPGLPDLTGRSFNESTGRFNSLPSNWEHEQPSVSITDTTVLEWSCQYRVTVSGALAFPQTAVSVTNDNRSNLTSAIQVTNDIQSDNYVAGTSGWNIERDTGDAEFNNITARGDITMTGGELNIINGSRTAAITPEGTGLILDVTSNSNGDMVRFLKTAGTGDAINLRKENAGGSALFVDIPNSFDTNGIYIESSSDAGQGLQILMDGAGNGDGILVQTNHGAGSTGGEFNNYLTNGGHIQLALSPADGGYAAFAVDGDFLVSAGHSYATFTGAHHGMIENTATPEEGDILVDVSPVSVSISDGFFEVAISSSAKHAGVIGVYARDMSWGSPTQQFPEHEATHKKVVINALGEGGINVCGEGGNISKGDLIVTSSIPGKGMKQADDIVRSYTVAKAREDVTFSGPNDIKMIACIYLCG